MNEKINPKDIKTAEKLEEALTKVTSVVDKLSKSMDEFGKTGSKNLNKNLKDLKNFDGSLGKAVDRINDLNRSIQKLEVEKKLNKGQAAGLNKELKSMRNEVARLSGMKVLSGTALNNAQKSLIKLENEIDGVEKEFKEAEKGAKSFLDVTAESGPSFLRGWASFRKEAKAGQGPMKAYEGYFKKAGTKLGKMPGMLKLVGKASKGLGVALGGVTKMFMGWPGLIVMAVKKLWDIGMAADQLAKDANKAFALLRGPDIMTSDIKGQFREFNEQIYNAGANIRTGMDVTQIRELLYAMSQAGVQIPTLNQGLMTYRDAIYIAAKASKTLGMDLPWVGSKIGELLTDLRMDLAEIDKAFIQVAFDAKKSGLSTDRFWTTVENASASLALYGVFIGSASKTMKRFTEDQIAGAKDASEATEGMYDIFKQGAKGTSVALLNFAQQGGVNLKKMFKDIKAGFKGKAWRNKGKDRNSKRKRGRRRTKKTPLTIICSTDSGRESCSSRKKRCCCYDY